MSIDKLVSRILRKKKKKKKIKKFEKGLDKKYNDIVVSINLRNILFRLAKAVGKSYAGRRYRERRR
jgi:hypothetical protein